MAAGNHYAKAHDNVCQQVIPEDPWVGKQGLPQSHLLGTVIHFDLPISLRIVRERDKMRHLKLPRQLLEMPTEFTSSIRLNP